MGKEEKKVDIDKKLEEVLRIVEENRKEIDVIRRYMRRTFVLKLVYWVIIIAITAGAVYAARPYAKKAIETYHSVKDTIERTSDVVEKPAHMFQDIKFLKKIFELNSE